MIYIIIALILFVIPIVFLIMTFTDKIMWIVPFLLLSMFAILILICGFVKLESEAYKRGQIDCLNGNIKYEVEKVDTVKIYKVK
jgi:hypothetical protein